MLKPIGEILIEQGSINQDQLGKALDQQKKDRKKRLGEVLIEMGVISETDIVVALSLQSNFAYLPLKNIAQSQEAREWIPAELIRQYSFIPIDYSNGTLSIVMSDPSDEKVIDEIEKQTKCKLQIFITTMTELDNAIRSQYEKSEGTPNKS